MNRNTPPIESLQVITKLTQLRAPSAPSGGAKRGNPSTHWSIEQWPHPAHPIATDEAGQRPGIFQIFQTIENLAGEELWLDARDNGEVTPDLLANYWYEIWSGLGNPGIAWPAEALIKASGQFEMLHSMMHYEDMITQQGQEMLDHAVNTVIAWHVKELIAREGEDSVSLDLVRISNAMGKVHSAHCADALN